MDEVLAVLAHSGPEHANGDTNHGPMAAEALCFLGHEDAAIQWARSYKSNLLHHVPTRQHIPANQWKEYLGNAKYFDGWKHLFVQEIENSGWESTLKCWLPRLIPAIVSAAAHGALRTAHAVRSLENKPSALKIDELSSGLAYWAATFQTLPEAPYDNKPLKASEAIKILHLIPDSEKEGHEQISDSLNQLQRRADFAPVINMLDTSFAFDQCLDDILKTFVHSYMTNASKNLIVDVHTVTGPATLQLLTKHIGEADRKQALKYAWQASAAMHVTYDACPPDFKNAENGGVKSDADLIDAAIRSQDAHAIKFTEVCLRLSRTSNNPLYKLAAQDATRRFTA